MAQTTSPPGTQSISRRWPLLPLVFLLTGLALAPRASALPPGPSRPSADPGRAAPFAPTLLPSTSGSAVACVIVAPDSIADVYQRLADFQTRTGRPTVVRSISTVRSLDPRANDLAQAVRSFLRAAYLLWGTRWAMLAGDHEAIPMRMARVLLPMPEDIPTDSYYADLDGTWDRDGDGLYGEVADSLDMTADLAVGRLSAGTRAEALAMVDKAISYRTSPHAAIGKHLLLAEVLDPSTWTPGMPWSYDGAAQAEQLAPRTPACVLARRYYENHTVYPGALALTKASATAALGMGNHVVAHFGHGSRSQLSIGSELMTATELAAAANADSAALWISNNCASAAVDYDCVAERLVRKPVGGALAYVGATRDAYPSSSAIVTYGVFDRLFGAAPTTLAEAVETGRAGLLPGARSETLSRLGWFETVLLGVPSLPIWKCPPGAITVTRPSTVPISATSFTVTVTHAGAPVESALVVAWKAGEDYRAEWTGPTGQAVVPFHPGTTGPFSLAVDAREKIPFLDSLSVTSSSSARYAALGAAARDDLGGDGDGVVGVGESFGIAGSIRNGGTGAGAGALTVTLQALTSGLAVDVASAGAPALGGGFQTNVPNALRAHALASPVAARSERLRLLVSDAARTDTTEFSIAVGAPEPLLVGNLFSDAGTGNGNGVLEAGETASLAFTIGNDGGARARLATAQLTNPAAGVTLIDVAAVGIGDVVAEGTAGTPALKFQVAAVPSGRLFDLRVQDAYGHAWTFPVERSVPSTPTGLRVDASAIDRILLAWTAVSAGDLLGYRVYRGPNDGSTPALVTLLPVRRSPAYEDIGLSILTTYRYQVSAVDSSGNEGPRSAILVASTTPPALVGWPLTTGQSTSSNVGLADLDGDNRPEVLVGSDYLYVVRSDGTEWRDGDLNPVTTGIFSTVLHNIASSPATADLDQDGTPEIVAASWNDSTAAVFRSDGTLMPGWPRKGAAPFWSVPAVGDIDGDGALEIVIGSNAPGRLYAWNADGSDVYDGDANPATAGVYYVPTGTVISSPAIADLDRNGLNEVVFGTSMGQVHAVRQGSELSGWPFTATGLLSASPAIGDIVPGGGLDVAIASSDDSVYVLTSSGARAPGWPRPLELTPGNGRVSSPVLAPLRAHLGDPSLCVIACGMDGRVVAFGPSGSTLPGWSAVYLGAATEASPAVADLDGDGSLEVIAGAEDRRVHAFHFDGTPVSGFPIEIGAEVRGTPAIWDLDGDGACDLVVAGWDRNVYAWRYPGTFHAAGMAWPMFHHDSWRTGVSTFPILTAVKTERPTVAPPAVAVLEPNRPNPFNPSTTIGYIVPGTAPLPVTLRVFSSAGRLVRTLVSRREEPGYHVARWDGRDDRGFPAASGVYLLRAEIGAAVRTQKMALLR